MEKALNICYDGVTDKKMRLIFYILESDTQK